MKKNNVADKTETLTDRRKCDELDSVFMVFPLFVCVPELLNFKQVYYWHLMQTPSACSVLGGAGASVVRSSPGANPPTFGFFFQVVA